MGLAALMLLQQARAAARFDSDGNIVLLEDQDRSRWSSKRIAEGLALIDKAMRHRRPGPYQVQAAIAALHARARRAEDTDWAQIDLLYANLERLQPSPVVTLNRAVAVNKMRGPAAALAMIEPLDERLVELLLLPRREGCPAAAARPPRRGARGLRPGDFARQHAGRGRPHPPASRPSGQGTGLGWGRATPVARSFADTPRHDAPLEWRAPSKKSSSSCRLSNPSVRPWAARSNQRRST